MEVSIKHDILDITDAVFETAVTQENTTEAIVPDVMPDILRVLDTSATVLLRSKEADSGRVTVGGIINVSVIYTPDGHEICSLETGVPYSVSAADPEIVPDCDVIASVAAVSADAATVNPRKVIVRVNTLTEVSCFTRRRFEIASGLEGEDASGFEQLLVTREVRVPAAVTEKRFTISDEIELPDGASGGAKLLKSGVRITAEDHRFAGSKLVMRGKLEYDLLIKTAGQEIVPKKCTSEFSQMIDTETAPDGAGAVITVMPTGVYFEESDNAASGPKLIAEISAVAQCRITSAREVTVLSDVYSNRFCTASERVSMAPPAMTELGEGSITERESIKLPDGAGEVVYTSVRALPADVFDDGGCAAVKIPVEATAVYRDGGGELQCKTARFEHTDTSETPFAPGMTVEADMSASTRAGGGVVELETEVRYVLRGAGESAFEHVCEITELVDEPDTGRKPSVVIIRAEGGDDLWALGKRYHSTAAAIKSANDLSDGEGVPAGGILMIPRVRA